MKNAEMFKWFKRSKNGKGRPDPDIKMVDIEGQPLMEGDLVESLRYELGRCRLIQSENGLAYESIETGEVVHFARMIDAATSFQKVRKLE